MQFSESWLRTFVNPALSSDELAHLLTMSGLEVEETRPVAPPFAGIVVAQVLEVVRHPNADRLRVCQVDAGTGTILNIVCGAPNVRPGIKVPCATIGAQLPPAEEGGAPFEIRPVKMRGVESHGMLCSASELKLSEDHDGLMILPDDLKVGQDLRAALDLDDRLMTLKLTPNRADCLSVFGVAREVAALTGAALRWPESVPVAPDSEERLPVRIEAPDLCGRFAGRVIRGLNARAATPDWMKQRLARSGQRSISALVDISNYVMLELGRPTHVFDLAKVHAGLTVRWARHGESLKLLNGNTVELDETVGVIATGDQVESLAGIMGGDASAVTLDTTDVYLEAAFWWPQAIQGRTRRFNFSTDAAHRFERGVDYSTIPEHLEIITRLILDICGVPDQTRIGPVDDHVVNLPQRKPVALRTARVHKVIGVPVPAEQIAGIFGHLEFACEASADGFVVTPPSWRFDIEIEEDLIEEVARCHGYDNIPARLPTAPHVMRARSEKIRDMHDLRARMAAADYNEVLNFSFVEERWERDFVGNADPIRLLNPIASQLAVMRSSLIGSLIGNLRYNLNRQAERVRVFEIGRVFRRDAAVPDGPLTVAGIAQPVMLGALAYGQAVEEQWGQPARRADFFDVKADLESLCAPLVPRFVKAIHPALHPGRSARIELEGQAVGWIGELHPRWVRDYELADAPVLFEIQADILRAVPLPVCNEIPRFPAVTRDLALVFEETVAVQDVLDEIVAASGDMASFTAGQGTATDRQAMPPEPAFAPIREARLFDEYRGKGLKDNEKSLAFRFRLQDTQQTLSDEMIEATLANVTERLRVKFGGRLR